MASYPARKGDIPFDAFLDLVADGQKADLLDGVIYVASPDNTDASDLLSWLAFIFIGFVEQKALGKIYLNRVTYRIGPNRGPEPDLGFVPRELEALRRRGYIDGPPALALEIVSPDSVERDYVLKRAIYEQAGVREYWILDPDDNRATFLFLRKGRYKKVAPVKHIIRSQVIPGLWFDVRWLLSDERPRPFDFLSQLLRESEG
jgi:Uma2 family endonuclease